MNINGLYTALLSDQDFTSEEIYEINSFVIASGVNACYVESLRDPPNAFLPLRCSDIEYTGKLARKPPENRAKC